jgi:serine/threonine protein kinase
MAVASLFEDLLDQYKIEQHIAEKRYTDLYEAYDVDDDRLVRVEILRAGYAEDSSFAGRFVNRARALAQIRHPNIAQVLHIGKAAGGAPYVAQASVDGNPLSFRLEQLAQRNTPVNPIYALKLVRQLADALLLAERLELFHYDLQPDNILLKNVALPVEDSVVLIDLFIPAEKRRQNGADGMDDRQAYLSPEQRAGKEITTASHVYSLGVLLYRLLAGRLPDGPATLGNTIVERVLGHMTPLERVRGDLSVTTCRFVEQCLSKEPGRRYISIEAFTVALENALAAEEARLSANGRAAANDRRLSTWIFPALVMILFLMIGAVASLGWRERGTPTAVVASTSADISGAVITPTAVISPTATEMKEEDERLTSVVASAGTSLVESTAAIGDRVTPSPTPEPSWTTTPSPTTEPTFTPTLQPTPDTSPFVRVMHNMVNLRNGPGLVFPVVGSVVGGEKLEVLARNDSETFPWYLVVTGNQRIGWIAATVVQPDDSLALAAIPVAVTIPATPFPTATIQPTPSSTPETSPPAPTSESGGGGGGIDDVPTEEPVEPTSEPPVEPTRTPPGPET